MIEADYVPVVEDNRFVSRRNLQSVSESFVEGEAINNKFIDGKPSRLALECILHFIQLQTNCRIFFQCQNIC